MIEKYGKPINMKKIGRNLDSLKGLVEESINDANRFYKKSDRIPICRICGSNNSHLYTSVLEKYEYYECENCNSIFLNNLPNVEEMYSSTDTANGDIYIDEATYKKRVTDISGPKVDFVLTACNEQNIHIEQWLDIGCGGGEILSYLKNTSNILPLGIESDQSEYKFATNLGLDIYNSFVDPDKGDKEIEKRIAESDIVSFFNVLEHVEDPVVFMSYIIEHMKKGGVLVFEAPRHPAMSSFVNQTATNIVYRHIVPPIHLHLFNEKSLDYLFKDQMNILAKWEFG